MFRAAVVVAALAGCVQSGEVVCSDGRLCPPGYQCDDVNMRCLSAEQVAACSGRGEGADCSFGGVPGACRRGACEPLTCGDGIKSGNEACDGIDFGDATCRDAGFYDEAGLACTEFCTFEVTNCTGFCGDNVVNGAELCDGAPPPGSCADFGFDAGPITCGISCGTSFDSCAKFGWVPELTGLSQAFTFDASSPSDVWVGGQTVDGHQIAHFAGNVWTLTPFAGTKAPRTIEAIGVDDAWLIAGSTDPELHHFTGGAWTSATGAPAATYRDLFDAGANAVFVATADAGVLEWNGASWQTVGSLAVAAERIEGSAADDLWIVSDAGELHRWDGAQWSAVPVDIMVRRVTVAGRDDVWVIGASTTAPDSVAIGHWDGDQWTITVDSSLNPQFGQNLTAVTASSAHDVWVAAPIGRARHFEGHEWAFVGGVTFDPTSSGGFSALQSFPGITLGLTFDGYFYRYRGQMWARLDTSSVTTLVSSASLAPGQTIAIDFKSDAYFFDNNTWTQVTVDPSLPSRGNRVIWAAAPNDVWVAGSQGRLFRYDGNTWNDTAWGFSQTTNAIVGFASDDVWIFGASAIHYDGATFSVSLSAPGGTIVDASGSSSSDVWAIVPLTSSTTVYHWDGFNWASSTVNDALTAIVAFSPTNAFATSSKRIWHYDGTAWTFEMVPVVKPFIGLSATGPADVFAATAAELMHFDGQRWTSLRGPDDVVVANRNIRHIDAHRGYIDLVYDASTPGNVPLRRLIRTRPWVCEATETHCSDGVDDDCDNTVDDLDADCP